MIKRMINRILRWWLLRKLKPLKWEPRNDGVYFGGIHFARAYNTGGIIVEYKIKRQQNELEIWYGLYLNDDYCGRYPLVPEAQQEAERHYRQCALIPFGLDRRRND